MSSDTILSSSLTGKNECESCKKHYTLKVPLRHQLTIHGEKNVQMSFFHNNMTARKGNLTSHQKVRTRKLTLNRKRKASEAQLST